MKYNIFITITILICIILGGCKAEKTSIQQTLPTETISPEKDVLESTEGITDEIIPMETRPLVAGTEQKAMIEDTQVTEETEAEHEAVEISPFQGSQNVEITIGENETPIIPGER